MYFFSKIKPSYSKSMHLFETTLYSTGQCWVNPTCSFQNRPQARGKSTVG